MNKYIYTVETRKQELKLVILKKKEALKKAPPGRLEICGKKFYQVFDNKASGRKYISKENMDFIKQLAQKGYDIKVRRLAQAELTCLNAGRFYMGTVYEDVYENLDPRRQALVEPEIMTKEMLRQAWKSRPYKKKGFKAGEPRYKAGDELYVRSRAELFCISCFNKYSITFLYEYPVKLKSGMLVYPDFCIMDPETGGDIFFEYFGIIDSPEYANMAAKKLNDLAMAGVIIGKNLVVAMETSKVPMNTEALEIIIRENFVPKADQTL